MKVIKLCLLLFICFNVSLGQKNRVFWTEQPATRTGNIGTINIDGSGESMYFGEYQGYGGIDFDDNNNKLYIANNFDGKIQVMDGDGSNITDLITDIHPRDVALDLTHQKIYWTNYTYSDPKIMRADLDGNNIEDFTNSDVLKDGCDLSAIVVDEFADPVKVYFVERWDKKIKEAWEGYPHWVGTLFDCKDGGLISSWGLELAGNYLYWSSRFAGSISRGDLTNESKIELYSGLSTTMHIAVDAIAGKIYWIDGSSDSNGKIVSANINGSTAEADYDIIKTGINSGWGLALSNDRNSTLINDEKLIITDSYQLFPIYPNPCNPETNIRYNIPKQSQINVNIYNLLGQLIKTLISEKQSMGQYVLKWNGTDNKNQPVGNGVYLCQLISDNGFNKTEKVILLK